MTIYQRIEEEQEIRNFTRADLSRMTDIPESTIRGWSRGSIPSAEAIYKIAKVFNVTVEYLVTGKTVSDSIMKYTPEERKLLDQIRMLSNANKKTVELLVNTLTEQQEMMAAEPQKDFYEVK